MCQPRDRRTDTEGFHPADKRGKAKIAACTNAVDEKRIKRKWIIHSISSQIIRTEDHGFYVSRAEPRRQREDTMVLQLEEAQINRTQFVTKPGDDNPRCRAAPATRSAAVE